MRITIQILLEAERLLLSGMSQRKVASRLGIHRNTLQYYVRQKFELRYKQEPENDGITYFDHSTQTTKRCEKCGWQVKEPCLYCQIREFREKKRKENGCTREKEEKR